MATKAKTAAKKTTPAKGPSKADQRLAEICVALEKKGEATAKDIGVPSTYFTAAVKAGLIKVASSVKSGGRGRPAFTYKLTAKGKKVAQKNA